MSGLLLDPRGVCIIRGKDFPNAVRGQLAAADLGLVPLPVQIDSLLEFFPERNISSGFTDRCCHHLINIGLSVLIWRGPIPEALSWGRHTVCSNAAVFQDGGGVTQVVEKKGSAVRGSLTVVAFVAGVLPFRVKAHCLKLQPVSTSACLHRTKAASQMNPDHLC